MVESTPGAPIGMGGSPHFGSLGSVRLYGGRFNEFLSHFREGPLPNGCLLGRQLPANRGYLIANCWWVHATFLFFEYRLQVHVRTPPPLCISYALVQATVGVGTVLIWDLILIRYQR